MNLHFSTLISHRNSIVEAKGAVYDDTRSLTTSSSCQGAAFVQECHLGFATAQIPSREKMVRIVSAFQLELHEIITYNECLKVAITIPEGGSRGHPGHIRRSLLTDNPPTLVKVVHTIGVYVPHSFRTVVWVLLRPTRIR